MYTFAIFGHTIAPNGSMFVDDLSNTRNTDNGARTTQYAPHKGKGGANDSDFTILDECSGETG